MLGEMAVGPASSHPREKEIQKFIDLAKALDPIVTY